MKVNIKKLEEKKVTMAVIVYESVKAEMEEIADKTGISIQNLYRSSINDGIAKFKEQLKEEN